MQRYALNDPLVNVLIPLWEPATRIASGTHGGRSYLSDGVAIVFLTQEQRDAVLLGIGLSCREGLWTAPSPDWAGWVSPSKREPRAIQTDWGEAPELSSQFPQEADLVPMRMTWFCYGWGAHLVHLAVTSEGVAAFDGKYAPLWAPYTGADLRWWRDGEGMEGLVGLGWGGATDLLLAGLRPQAGLTWRDAVREAFGSVLEEVAHVH